MADNNVVEILKGVVGELRQIATSETVVGDPVQAGDTTILPVVKVSVGFGAGGGQGEDQKHGSGFGGGGGGGAKIEPAGFIIVSKDDVKFLPAGKGKWEGLIDAIPGLAKKISKWTSKVKSDADTDPAEDDNDTNSEEPTD
ncbi:MAG: spore germination protein GerW family protein [bacterium]|nr:spore germination protein GerW family protein [bacterium]